MRISDWSSDVCSSDLETVVKAVAIEGLGWSPDKIAAQSKTPTHERIVKWMEEMRKLSGRIPRRYAAIEEAVDRMQEANPHLSPEQAHHLTVHGVNRNEDRSEEHTSELQSLMRISYAVFCLKKKTEHNPT